jgi:hypothetical protein
MAGGKQIAIINVGGTGTGKSTEVRKILKSLKPSIVEIYDINGEFDDITGTDDCERHDIFLERVKTLQNATVVFEEATIFFSNRGSSEKLTEMLVRKRHLQTNIILNFHSVRSIPKYVFDFVDYVFLRKTNDTLKSVKEKIDNDRFIEIFEKVNNDKNPYAMEIYKVR